MQILTALNFINIQTYNNNNINNNINRWATNKINTRDQKKEREKKKISRYDKNKAKHSTVALHGVQET